jgi:hypothetical protein
MSLLLRDGHTRASLSMAEGTSERRCHLVDRSVKLDPLAPSLRVPPRSNGSNLLHCQARRRLGLSIFFGNAGRRSGGSSSSASSFASRCASSRPASGTFVSRPTLSSGGWPAAGRCFPPLALRALPVPQVRRPWAGSVGTPPAGAIGWPSGPSSSPPLSTRATAPPGRPSLVLSSA